MAEAMRWDEAMRGATVVDGSGRSRFEVDMGLAEGSIVEGGADTSARPRRNI